MSKNKRLFWTLYVLSVAAASIKGFSDSLSMHTDEVGLFLFLIAGMIGVLFFAIAAIRSFWNI